MLPWCKMAAYKSVLSSNSWKNRTWDILHGHQIIPRCYTSKHCNVQRNPVKKYVSSSWQKEIHKLWKNSHLPNVCILVLKGRQDWDIDDSLKNEHSMRWQTFEILTPLWLLNAINTYISLISSPYLPLFCQHTHKSEDGLLHWLASFSCLCGRSLKT